MVFVDVREPDEFAGGHVNGAINIPPAELMTGAHKLDSTAKDESIIVYCRTGSRSAVAIHMLKELGFTNLKNGINQDYVNKNYLVS